MMQRKCVWCGRPLVIAADSTGLVHEGGGAYCMKCPRCGWEGGPPTGTTSCPKCSDPRLRDTHAALAKVGRA